MNFPMNYHQIICLDIGVNRFGLTLQIALEMDNFNKRPLNYGESSRVDVETNFPMVALC